MSCSTTSTAQIKVKYLYGSIHFDLHDLLSSRHVHTDEKDLAAIYAVDIAEKVSFRTPFNQDDIYIIREGRSLHTNDILFDKNSIEQLHSRGNLRMGGMNAGSTLFILMKPSVSKLVPLVFQLPIVRDSENGRNDSDFKNNDYYGNDRKDIYKKSYSKTLYFPANMKIFQLKRSLFTSKTTSLKPQSLTLVIGGRVAHDQTMIGDYFFKYSSFVSRNSSRGPVPPKAAESADNTVKSLNCNPLQVQLLQTFNLNHEVDVNIVLKDKQALKFSTEISKPIIRIRQFLLQQLRIPLHIPLVIYLDLDTKKSIELHPDYSLIDYGITSSDKAVNVSLARLKSNSLYTAPLPWDALTKSSLENTPEVNVTNSLIESILGGGDISNSDVEKLLAALSSNAGVSDFSNGLMSTSFAVNAAVETPKKNNSTPSASSANSSGGNGESKNSNSSNTNNSCTSLSRASGDISKVSKPINKVTSKESGGFLSGFKKGFLLGGSSGGGGNIKKVVATLQTPPKKINKSVNGADDAVALAPSYASSPESIVWSSKPVVSEESSCNCCLGKENINTINGDNTVHTLMDHNMQLREK